MIPEKLLERWIGNGTSSANGCNYKYDNKFLIFIIEYRLSVSQNLFIFFELCIFRHFIFPHEIYSTVDIELNETLFLTFQVRFSLKHYIKST